MKNKLSTLIKFVKAQSKQNKFIAAGVLLAILISASAFALNEPKQNQPAAPEATNTQITQPQTEAVAAATTDETQPQPQAETQKPASTQNKPAAPKPTSTPSASQQAVAPAVPITHEPTSAPDKPPHPGYDISIDYDSFTSTGPNSFYVRFNVIRSPGYTGSLVSSGSILTAPNTPNGVTCDTELIDQNSGRANVTFPDTAPLGMYVCKIILTDGTSTRDMFFSFTLANE